jgi:site-specific recombinase XerD
VRRLKKRWRAGVIDDLPISRGLARVLRRYLAAAAVAPGERAFPMTVRNLELLFKRYLKLAGILADFPLYALRHTALTRAYRRTGDLRLVQQLAGHASITTTQIYTHISQDDLRRSAELTGSIL